MAKKKEEEKKVETSVVETETKEPEVKVEVETKTEEKVEVKKEPVKEEKKVGKTDLSKFIEDLKNTVDNFVSYDFDCVRLKDKIKELINKVK